MRLDTERRQVLRVHSCVANSHAQQVLKEADMVLAVGAQPVSSYADVERLIAEHARGRGATVGDGAAPPAKRSRLDAAEGQHAPPSGGVAHANGGVGGGAGSRFAAAAASGAAADHLPSGAGARGVGQVSGAGCAQLAHLPHGCSRCAAERAPPLLLPPAGWAARTGWAPTA